MIEEVAKKFCIENLAHVKTPVEEKLKIRIREAKEITKLTFNELLGSLLYIMLVSRSDVCYTVIIF